VIPRLPAPSLANPVIRCFLLLTALAVAGCAVGAGQSPTANPAPPTRGPAATVPPPALIAVPYDLDRLGPPRFVTADYIDLDAIDAISRFRSAEGHDYADGVERCRSMKHYFRPRETVDAAAIGLYAPVTGTVAYVRDDLWGKQVGIRPDADPAFTVILFHVNPAQPLVVGTRRASGQRLGTHIGPQTWSDVAVGVDTPGGYRLVSWFEVLTDDVWRDYQARGLRSRAEPIISRAERDADPLTCGPDGQFTSRGTLPGWVDLR
jgi:hypothetical protein